MGSKESVTVTSRPPLRISDATAGMVLGSIGVAAFSFTFPATKLALRGFDPLFIAFGRASVAAIPAGALVLLGRAPRPSARQWRQLVVVALGVVIGFPALSSLALKTSSSAHGAVVIALLPALTALFGVLRAQDRPGPRFWAAALLGAAIIGVYTIAHAGGAPSLSDLYLLVAVVVCALGYTEGALLSRSLGAPQTICWALLLSLPLTLTLALLTAPGTAPSGTPLLGFLYVSFFSMFLGFFAWYGGLARGGVARVSQIQLIQTPLTLVWSALVLGERITAATGAVAIAVLACVAATQRARIARR